MRISISLFLKTVLVAIFFFQFSEDVDGLNVCLRDPRRPFYYLPSSRNGRVWLWFLVDFLLNHNFVMIFYWFYRYGDQVIQERLINIPFFLCHQSSLYWKGFILKDPQCQYEQKSFNAFSWMGNSFWWNIRITGCGSHWQWRID